MSQDYAEDRCRCGTSQEIFSDLISKRKTPLTASYKWFKSEHIFDNHYKTFFDPATDGTALPVRQDCWAKNVLMTAQRSSCLRNSYRYLTVETLAQLVKY